MPMETSAPSGSMSIGNSLSKYGEPTESGAAPRASAISGASVPTSTMAAATTRKMLL